MCSGVPPSGSSTGSPSHPVSPSERQPDAETNENDAANDPANLAITYQSQIISTAVLRPQEHHPPLESAELVSCVARALVLAIETPRQPPPVTTEERPGIFDSSVVPNISIERYLQRLKAVFECSDAIFVLALIMVDRILEKDGIEPYRITMRNVHRLYLASLIVTVKFNEDLVYGNSHYARAGGIQLREVNRLERFFLRALDYDFHVQPEHYHIMVDALAGLRHQIPAKAEAPRHDAKAKAGYAKAVTAAATAKASPAVEAPTALVSQT